MTTIINDTDSVIAARQRGDRCAICGQRDPDVLSVDVLDDRTRFEQPVCLECAAQHAINESSIAADCCGEEAA